MPPLLRTSLRWGYEETLKDNVMSFQSLRWKSSEAVERFPDKVSNIWLFRGTRVPVAALFENLAAGATIDEFLEWFPAVERWQVESVLEHEARAARESSVT